MRSQVHRDVLDWFERDARDFPWRRTRDPYRTLVAEVMLQQTQTSRVGPSYDAFLQRFPNVRALAVAERADVVRAWQGLGYNRRAVNLHLAARAIVAEHRGRIPSDPAVLRTLPGIGEYTAAAVASFAFGLDVAVVDVNVGRVLSRFALGVDAAPPASLRAVAREWLPAGRAYEWNLALMDIGATRCRRVPRCEGCPLAGVCAFRKAPTSMRAPSRTQGPFEGSRRQARGAIVEHLRSAEDGASVAELTRAVPKAARPHVTTTLAALERDGLIRLSPAARAGSLRGKARLA